MKDSLPWIHNSINSDSNSKAYKGHEFRRKNCWIKIKLQILAPNLIDQSLDKNFDFKYRFKMVEVEVTMLTYLGDNYKGSISKLDRSIRLFTIT